MATFSAIYYDLAYVLTCAEQFSEYKTYRNINQCYKIEVQLI